MSGRVVYHDGALPPSVGTGPFEESKTRQSEAADADINTIIDRFVRQGVPLPPDDVLPVFLDVTKIGDFRQVRDHINAATGLFMQLDAAVRARFANDPAEFLDFVVDPANKGELAALGLLPAEKPVVPAGVPAVPVPEAK